MNDRSLILFSIKLFVNTILTYKFRNDLLHHSDNLNIILLVMKF